MIPNEQQISIGPEAIHATHHQGDGEHFVIVAPPLFEEDARLRKVVVNLGRYLCAEGCDVVRFDYYGTGYGPGHYEDVTLERAAGNLEQTIEYCAAKGAKRISVVGVRFGAYLALGAAGRSDVNRVIALEPIANPAAYIKDVLRSEVTTQMLIYDKVLKDRDRLIEDLRTEGRAFVEGFCICGDLFEQMSSAPAIKPDELNDKVAVVFWQTRRDHKKWAAAHEQTHWVDGIKFAFNHIRYMGPRSDALYRVTLEGLRHE